MRRRSFAWLVLGAFSFVVVSQAVFTAANTIPKSSAGYASKAVSGYTISNVVYNLNDTTPTNVDSVTFTATSDGGSTAPTVTAYARFVAAAGWYACTRVGGVPPAHNISCDTDATPGPQLTATAINTLDTSIVEQ